MLDLLEHPLTTDRDVAREPSATRPHSETALPQIVHDRDDGLLATAGPLMAAAYAIALAIAALTFMASSEALFVITISTGFAVMFFTLPWLMLGVRVRHDKRWVRPEEGRSASVVETLTGPIGAAKRWRRC
jgi:hypothetical protein